MSRPIRLGLEVLQRWDGEMHAARFLTRPAVLSIGPDGTLPIPPELIGARRLCILAQPHGADGFALRLDQPAMRGVLHLGSKTVDLEALHRGMPDALVAPVLPMRPDTRAELVFGAFQFTLRLAPVPPSPRLRPWRREHLPLLLCFAGAALLVLGPLWASLHAPPPRAHLAQRGQVEDPLERAEPVAFEWTEAAPAEPGPVIGPSPTAAPPAALPQDVARPSPRPAPAEVAPNLPAPARVRAALEETTQALDRALGEPGAAPPGTHLWQPGDTPEVRAAPVGLGMEELAGPRQDLPGGEEEAPQGPGPTRLKLDTPEVTLHATPQRVTRVSSSGAQGDGELPISVIRATITAHMGGLRACYQKGLQGNPDLGGHLRIAFLIQPEGDVAAARIDRSDLGDGEVEDCILAHVKLWHFAPASGGGSTQVRYPLTFASR